MYYSNLMRKLKSISANRIVFLWEPAPDSVSAGYHEILGWVKSSAPTARSWVRGDAYGVAEQTICKLVYQFAKSLRCNANRTLRHIASSHDDLAFYADTKRNERAHLPLVHAAVRLLPAIAMIREACRHLAKRLNAALRNSCRYTESRFFS
jgi:hypothetical protein